MHGSNPRSAGEAPTALQHTTVPWGCQHCQTPADGSLDLDGVRSASGCLPTAPMPVQLRVPASQLTVSMMGFKS